MKTIGLLGGMSWESTQVYYRTINREVRAAVGGLSSAELVLYSVDFGTMAAQMQQGRWDEVLTTLKEAARRVEGAGADFIIICTNTMHRFFEELEAAVSLPFLHIADPTAQLLKKNGVDRVGLTGTAPTMEEEFYRGRLREKHGLEVLTPSRAERAELNRIIFEELCQGQVREDSRKKLRSMLEAMEGRGAQGHILGCTELAMLQEPTMTPRPILDTAEIHAKAAAALALA